MKNIIFISVILCFLMTVSSCVKDNMAGPDAAFFGAVKDSIGGGLIEQDQLNGSRILAYEHGYETPTAQSWFFKITGEFRNNMVFSNTYDLKLRNANFFPIEMNDFVIKPGDNPYDFIAVPYLRIKDAEIKLDQTTNKITATFKIEAGTPKVKLKKIALFAFTDMYVGDPFKVVNSGGGDTKSFSPTIKPNPATVYTLTIDLTANQKTYKTGRSYFFRIGAIADGTANSGLSGVKYNYVPYVKITL
jgi:hypothetical protein